MGRLGPYSSLAVPAVQGEQDDPGIRGDTFRRNVSFLEKYLLHMLCEQCGQWPPRPPNYHLYNLSLGQTHHILIAYPYEP